MPSIKQAYQPMFLRRRAKDVLEDLPDKISHPVWLELSPEQQEKHDWTESRGVNELKELGNSATVQHVIALITELKLICNYESESNESVKLDYLKDELEELAAGDHKALIFSQYPNKTLKEILPELKTYHPKIYDGTLSDKARNKIVNDFQNTASLPESVGSLWLW